MAWVYGDSYGGVQGAAQQQRQMDSSDFFNSLHAAMSLSQAGQQSQQNDFQNQLAVAHLRSQQYLAKQAAARQAAEFAATMGWHGGNLDLARKEFDWKQLQTNAALEREKRLTEQGAEQDQQAFEAAKNFAAALNERQDIDQQVGELPTQADQASALKQLPWWRKIPGVPAQAAATDLLRPRFSGSLPQTPISVGSMSFGELSSAASAPLLQRRAALDEMLGVYSKSGAASLVGRGEDGRWVPTIQMPKQKAKSPASVKSSLGLAAPVPAAQTGPAMPTSQAEFDALPSGTIFINPADGKPYRKR